MTKPTQWPCLGCGAILSGRGGRRFCGSDCRPRCEVEGCEKPTHGKTYCSAHHTRWKRTGDPLTPLVRTPNIGVCSAAGCDQPMRKLTWCASHYGMWRTFGEIREWNFRWADPEPNCLVCNKPNDGSFKSRQFCTSACLVYWHREKGLPPDPECARCGVVIELATLSKTGHRTRRDRRLCRRCAAHHRTKATPGELALRDGPYCQLCGCDVDLLARRPDPMRPSVDHVVPKALGGSDASSNNQLTHLKCNQIKSDRIVDLLTWGSPP